MKHSKKEASKKVLLREENTNSRNSRSLFVENKRSDTLIFIIKFFAIFFFLTFILEILDLSILTNTITQITANLLKLQYLGNVIFIEKETFIVGNYCTGLMSGAILAGIIFAAKKPALFDKTKLLALGVIILLLVNIPRLMLVLYSAIIGFDAEMVHSFTWIIMSIAIILIWYFGLKNWLKIKNFNELI